MNAERSRAWTAGRRRMLVSLHLAAVIFFVVWTMKADPNKGCEVQLCVGESCREPITPRGFGTPPVRFGARVCFGSSARPGLDLG